MPRTRARHRHRARAAGAHLPHQYQRVRTGALSATPRDLVVDHVRDVLHDYGRACRTHDKEYA
ncbi:class II D-tagatose-bisphosphate aldolase non-catalytic subunit [Streptomyces sp. NPDC001076]